MGYDESQDYAEMYREYLEELTQSKKENKALLSALVLFQRENDQLQKEVEELQEHIYRLEEDLRVY
jgi:predicted  nucleic acid-binding Zn-ribbon protein